MIRHFTRWLLLIALLWWGAAPAAAQTDTGAICVSTFADSNGNGLRDESETPLAGVNINLATVGVIVATHITAENEPEHCFETLQPGVYTLTFTDSPTYRTTTANEGTFALAAGQRLTINPFGAVPVPTENLRAEVAAQVLAANEDEPLEMSTRLLISTVAAMIVMLFMIGTGAVLLAMIGGGRRKHRAA